ncbi:hypothetical protein JCM12856_30160 [Spirochaeta dissipatitropha]
MSGTDFVAYILDYLGIRLDIQGIENIPDSGKITLCANHPTGGLDGLALMQLAGIAGRDFRFAVNDLLLAIPQLQEEFVPVEVFGKSPGRKRMELLEAMYREADTVILFPSGRTARAWGRRVLEYPWSTSFVRMSARFDRLIVPVHISGKNSLLFNLVWRVRRIFGISANIEMFLLVHELARKKNTRVRLSVGPAYNGHISAARKDHADISRMLQTEVMKLPGLRGGRQND